MGICYLNLTNFCKLAGLEVEAFNVLRRREQVPMVPPPELSEDALKRRGFEASGALYLIMANSLADDYGMSRSTAAAIASKAGIWYQRWEDVASTSADFAQGHEPRFHILFAVVNLPAVASIAPKTRQPSLAIGTIKEIAEQYPNAHDVIAVSVTRCAALMRQRAAKARIDLTEFWEK